MKAYSYRKDFSVYFYDKNIKVSRLLKEASSQLGFNSHFYTSKSLFIQSVNLTLPHIVVIPFDESCRGLVREVKKISKEILILINTPSKSEADAYSFVESNQCYDVINDAELRVSRFKHRLDLAFEKWVMQIGVEESLNGKQATLIEGELPDADFINNFESSFSNYVNRLLSISDSSTLEKELVRGVGSAFDCEFAYFRTNESDESVRFVASTLPTAKETDNVGFYVPNFGYSSKRIFEDNINMEKLKSCLVSIGLEQSCESIQSTYYVQSDSKIFGVLVQLNKATKSIYNEVSGYTEMCALKMDALYKSEIIYNHLNIETRTFAYREKKFYEAISNEVSRSRRIQLPLAVAVIELTGENISSRLKVESTVIRVLKRFTRVTDVVGRVGNKRIGILLTHIESGDAVRKLEKLQKIIDAVLKDKKIFGLYSKVGLSSFPHHGEDAMSLLENAEEACDQANGLELMVAPEI